MADSILIIRLTGKNVLLGPQVSFSGHNFPAPVAGGVTPRRFDPEPHAWVCSGAVRRYLFPEL